MSEVVRTTVKAPEIKKKKGVSQVQKGNFYQSASSPVVQILFLQRTIGNQAVQKLMKSGGLQAKLMIGAPGDVYEQEADQRVADAVMRTPQPQAVSSIKPYIQRACPKCENDELKRQPIKEEEEKLQRKPVGEEELQVRVHKDAAEAAMASVADSSGGFQAKNQLPVSKSVQQLIQLKTVPTDYGEFETTKFTEADGRGVEITLKFHPDDSKVDAKKIALSQSIKTTLPSGIAYAINPNQTGRMVSRGRSGAGYYIDTLEGTNNPLYGQNNTLGPTQELKDTPASANRTAAPVNLGVNTNYEIGYCYKEKPTDASNKKQSAGLWDKPQGGKNKGESKMFETAAFAIEGTDKDKYYGSVKWGYKMEGTTAAPTVTKNDIELASKGTPTANFIEPTKLWNVGKTQGTLQVTAAPEATVLKGDSSGREKLAKDTKLKQLQTVMWGTDPAIQAEVLKADSTGSGKIIYIKVSDVKDIGDGSANKKLPVPAAKP